MKRLFFIFSIFSVLVVTACTPSAGVSENPADLPVVKEDPKNYKPVKQIQKIEVENVESDFGTKWKWESRVEIPASVFSVLEKGDFISFSTDKSDSLADYFQLVLQSGENYLGGNEEVKTNASFDTKYNAINLDAAEQTTEIFPQEDNIQSLKTNGLIIKGYGVKLFKVTINHYAVLLSDKNATENTKRLFNFLLDMYGKKIITGQMENAWNNNFNQLGKVYEKTGKYPALMGFDFMNYTGTSWDASGSNVQTERAIKFWNGKDYSGNKISDSNGIVAFCWHWHDPLHKDYSFNTSETTFRIPYDTNTKQWKTESNEYKAIIKDFDVIAAELMKLQNAGVPVIWRPLHEAAGNVGKYNNSGSAWFWWGAGNSTDNSVITNEDICGECFIALWKLMHEYFTNTKGLHNLIWLWNGQHEKFYPGSDYVDIIGDDIYPELGDYSSQKTWYNKFQAIDNTKMVTLSECGVMPTPDNCIKDGANWSYFMVWNDGTNGENSSSEENNGNFWYGEKYNPDAHKKEVYNSQYAITLDDVGDLTKY